MGNYSISIVTTLYRRIDYFDRLAKSIEENCKEYDIEWVLVDDGSEERIGKYIKESVNRFANIANRFIYVWQPNSGKHVALNKAFEIVTKDITVIIDDDDYFVDDAFDKIQKQWNGCFDKVGCVSFLRQSVKNNDYIATFPVECVKYNADFRVKEGIVGDFAETYRTDKLTEFRFPVYGNEKFLTEDTVWFQFGQKNLTKYVNDSLYYADYHQNGLTGNIRHHQFNSPMGMANYYRMRILSGVLPFKTMIKEVMLLQIYSKAANIKNSKYFLAGGLLSGITYLPSRIMAIVLINKYTK